MTEISKKILLRLETVNQICDPTMIGSVGCVRGHQIEPVTPGILSHDC